MNLEFIKPQNLGSLLMKSSQSNFNLQSPDSYLVRSYLITTVTMYYDIQEFLGYQTVVILEMYPFIYTVVIFFTEPKSLI